MTDLEVRRFCAAASGLDWDDNDETVWIGTDDDAAQITYDPLHDDAQAMALLKTFRLQIDPHDEQWNVALVGVVGVLHEDINRAICECVAQMQAAKPSGARDRGKTDKPNDKPNRSKLKN